MEVGLVLCVRPAYFRSCAFVNFCTPTDACLAIERLDGSGDATDISHVRPILLLARNGEQRPHRVVLDLFRSVARQRSQQGDATGIEHFPQA